MTLPYHLEPYESPTGRTVDLLVTIDMTPGTEARMESPTHPRGVAPEPIAVDIASITNADGREVDVEECVIDAIHDAISIGEL